MTAPWQEDLAAVREIVDETLGEAITVTPWVQGDYVSGPDPARPPFDVTAVLVVGAGDEANLSGGSGTTWRLMIPVGSAELHVDPDRFPGMLGVRQGDRVTAPVRGQDFEVLRIDRGQKNRLVLRLGVV